MLKKNQKQTKQLNNEQRRQARSVRLYYRDDNNEPG